MKTFDLILASRVESYHRGAISLKFTAYGEPVRAGIATCRRGLRGGFKGKIMRLEKVEQNGIRIAVVTGNEKVIADAQSALDLLASVHYETDADRIAIDKENIADEFFVLSTGLAGEVLQKFVNYHTKAAIYGDYSQYTSKPLKDFIYESNKGNDVFFVPTKDEAIRVLVNAR